MTPQQEQQLRLQAKSRGYDKVKEDAYVEFVKNKTGSQASIKPLQPIKAPSIVSQLPGVIKSGITSYVKKVGSDYMDSAKTILENTKNVFSGKKKVKDAVLQNAGEVAKSAFAPINEIIKPAVNNAADMLSKNPSFSKIANSKVGDKVSNAVDTTSSFYSQWSRQHPEAAKNLEAGVDIGTLLASAKTTETAAKPILRTAKSGLDTVKSTVDTVSKVGDNISLRPKVNLEEIAIKDATPAYNKKLIADRPINQADGTITPRVSEGGTLKGRTVNPTPLEKEAGQALTKVQNYPVNGTALEKYQAVQPEIIKRSKALIQSLKDEKILRPPQQVTKVVFDAVSKVPEESLLLQKSDPVITNYMRVVKNAIAQNDGTLAGEFRVRQIMDNAYENARGKMAFGSDKISALDDVHKAARNALNEDVISHARNTDVRAALKEEWDLIRAADVLRIKAEAEAGTSLGRLMQKYPLSSNILKSTAKAGVNASGLGLIIH